MDNFIQSRFFIVYAHFLACLCMSMFFGGFIFILLFASLHWWIVPAGIVSIVSAALISIHGTTLIHKRELWVAKCIYKKTKLHSPPLSLNEEEEYLKYQIDLNKMS